MSGLAHLRHACTSAAYVLEKFSATFGLEIQLLNKWLAALVELDAGLDVDLEDDERLGPEFPRDIRFGEVGFQGLEIERLSRA